MKKEFRFNDRKFRQLLLLVAMESHDDPKFGAIKLNKILFYSDFIAYRELGEPITGAEYRHLDEGPAPRQLLPVRKSMIDAGTIELRPTVYFNWIQERIIANENPDLSIFTPEEVRIVRQVIRELWDKNGTEVSEHSHNEPGWKVTLSGESIPYQTAWLSPEPLTEEQIEMGREVAERHGFTQ